MEQIIPDFSRDRYEGQMNVDERKALYELIMKKKPEIVVETGTCRGGGTTYYIASALRNLFIVDGIKREFHTIEMKEEFFSYALHLYYEGKLKYLKPFITAFYHGNSLDVLREVGFKKIDVAMLDGGADSMASLYDFTTIRHLIPIGGYVVLHDWGQSKCTYLKPVMNNDHDYQMESLTIDLAIWKRIGNFHQCS